MANVRNMEHLLHNTKKIVDHHHKMMIAKGEHFNIFSVLGVESKENKTHSNFLAELLNPKGSHLQGNKFLKLFMEIIGKELSEENACSILSEKFINSTTTIVTTEFSIGNLNFKDIEGGRIDILIENRDNKICIENKIYAQDQEAQIQRYCNFNKNDNDVFYLTLNGDDPHINSKGELESGKDFYNLSYQDHIVEWLELCLKEVPNFTSLREAINQYILLIKKLTNTLNMEQQKELQDLMTNYLEESSYIAKNYEKMISNFKNDFRKEVKQILEKRLGFKFEVKVSKAIDNQYSKLWIQPKEWKDSELKFGLEPFSGKGNAKGHLFIGLYNKSSLELLKNLPAENKLNNVWHHTRPILTEDGNKVKLNDLYSLKKLARVEGSEYEILLNRVVTQSVEFINEYVNLIPSKLIGSIKESKESLN